MREIPNDRIKRLESYVELDDYLDHDFALQQMATQAATEIASKLLEFGKVNRTALPHERTRYHFVIEVIIPDTPERPFHAKLS